MAEAGTGVSDGDLRGVLGTVPNPDAWRGCGVNMDSGGGRKPQRQPFEGAIKIIFPERRRRVSATSR
jgi:hypothetical protein